MKHIKAQAQNTSSVNATTRLAGSILRYRQFTP